MANIHQPHLNQAIERVKNISKADGQKLLDELALEQPELYLAILYVKQITQNPLHLMFFIELLMIIQVALKEKGIKLSTITEKDRRKAYNHYVNYAEKTAKLSPIEQKKAMDHYLEQHQEQQLLLFSMRSMADIGLINDDDTVTQELVLTINVLLNCIAAAKTQPIIPTTATAQ